MGVILGVRVVDAGLQSACSRSIEDLSGEWRTIRKDDEDRKDNVDEWLRNLHVLAGRWRLGGDGFTSADFEQLVSTLGEVVPAAMAQILADERARLGGVTELAIGLYIEGKDRTTSELMWGLPWELIRNFGDWGPSLRFIRVTGGQPVPEPSRPVLDVVVSEGPRKVPWSDTLPESRTIAAFESRLGDRVNVHGLGDRFESIDAHLQRDGDGGHQVTPSTGPVGDMWVFQGHGTPNGLWLADADGEPELMGSEMLGDLLGGRVRAAVLLSCSGGAISGVAHRLAQCGVATVGFGVPLQSDDAELFIQKFVVQVQVGRPIAAAALEAVQHCALVRRADGRAFPDVVVWQPDVVSIPLLRGVVGPSTLEVTDDRFGGDGWFVDRGDLESHVAEIVATSRVTVVEGEPGAGKSALLRTWWERSVAGNTGEFPIAAAALLRDPLLINLDAPGDWRALCERLGSALARSTNQESMWSEISERSRSLDLNELWDDLIDPLLRVANDTPDTLVVLIDELDQAGDRFNQLLEGAIERTRQAPWIRWVCASRPELPDLVSGVHGETVGIIDLGDPDDHASCVELARRLLQPLVDDQLLTEDAVTRVATEISNRADGLFLYVVTVCDILVGRFGDDGLFGDAVDVVDGVRLPTFAQDNKMYSLYQHALSSMWEDIAPILRFLAINMDSSGLSTAELAAIAATSGNPSLQSLNTETIGSALRSSRAFLEHSEDGDGVRRWKTHHQAFNDWVLTQANGQDSSLITAEYHAHFAHALNELRSTDPDDRFTQLSSEHMTQHVLAAINQLPNWHQLRAQSQRILEHACNDVDWTITRCLCIGILPTVSQLRDLQTYVNEPANLRTTIEALVSANTWASQASQHSDTIAAIANEAFQRNNDLEQRAYDRRNMHPNAWWKTTWTNIPPQSPGTSAHRFNQNVVATDVSTNGTIVLACGETIYTWGPTWQEPPQPIGRHEESVSSVAWSFDGRWVVSGGDDGFIRVWDPMVTFDGVLSEPIGRHEGWLESVGWSPDGRWVVSGGGDGYIRVWDPTTPQPPQLIGRHQFGISLVAWSPDGRWVVSGGDDGFIRVWDPMVTFDGVLSEPIGHHTRGVRSVAWSPDSRWVVSGGFDSCVRVWDPMVTFDGVLPDPIGHHEHRVESVGWSPDGRWVVSGGVDGFIRVWDPTTPQPLQLIGGRHEGWLESIGWSPDGRYVVSGGGDGFIRVWDPTTPQPPQLIGHHEFGATSVAWSFDGRWVVSGGHDSCVRVWDPKVTFDGVLPEPIGRHGFGVKSVAWSPDGRWVVSGGDDGFIRVWDPMVTFDGVLPEPIGRHASGVTSVGWSFDGRWVVSGGDDGFIRVWDPMVTFDGVLPEPIGRHASGVRSVAWSPDGRYVVSGGGDGFIRVWDPTTPQPPQLIGRHEGWVESVAWSFDGRWVVSGGYDNCVRVWDPMVTFDGVLPEPIGRHQGWVLAVECSLDGNRLASIGQTQIVVHMQIRPEADERGLKLSDGIQFRSSRSS